MALINSVAQFKRKSNARKLMATLFVLKITTTERVAIENKINFVYLKYFLMSQFVYSEFRSILSK